MKLLIEESVLRQALETFTHCYAETDRRINERAKLLVELRTALDAAEKVEPVAWIITTDNTNLHQLDPNRENNWLAFDVNQFKNDSARALVISNTQPLYLHPALDAAERVEPVAITDQLVCEIIDEAGISFRKHRGSIRGQMITVWDSPESHIVAAAIRRCNV